MIVDVHTHVWPDKIANAVQRNEDNQLPDLAFVDDGKVGSLERSMASSGVDLSCCMGIASTSRHVESVNSFVAGLAAVNRVPVGTVHVDLSVEKNLSSLRRNGIRIVKVHPLFQDVSLQDPRLWEIFEAFGDEIAVIAHVGAGGRGAQNQLSSPAMIREIATQFPRLRLIACHFGGYKMIDVAEETLAGTDVVLETSWPPGLSVVQPDTVRRFIRNHGADRVLFGSDWPMTTTSNELDTIRSLGLRDGELEQVLGGTARRVLRLDNHHEHGAFAGGGPLT